MMNKLFLSFICRLEGRAPSRPFAKCGHDRAWPSILAILFLLLCGAVTVSTRAATSSNIESQVVNTRDLTVYGTATNAIGGSYVVSITFTNVGNLTNKTINIFPFGNTNGVTLTFVTNAVGALRVAITNSTSQQATNFFNKLPGAGLSNTVLNSISFSIATNTVKITGANNSVVSASSTGNFCAITITTNAPALTALSSASSGGGWNGTNIGSSSISVLYGAGTQITYSVNGSVVAFLGGTNIWTGTTNDFRVGKVLIVDATMSNQPPTLSQLSATNAANSTADQAYALAQGQSANATNSLLYSVTSLSGQTVSQTISLGRSAMFSFTNAVGTNQVWTLATPTNGADVLVDIPFATNGATARTILIVPPSGMTLNQYTATNGLTVSNFPALFNFSVGATNRVSFGGGQTDR